jgi:hypothetical protein
VTDWDSLALGVIAAATLVMALIQVGAIVVAARIARQAGDTLSRAQQAIASAQQTLASVREEVQPIILRAQAIADEASRAATLASAQVTKADQVVTDLSRRIDETSAIVQQAIVTPAREGLAVLAALRAALAVLRTGADWRRRSSRSEEEDPLFIG